MAKVLFLLLPTPSHYASCFPFGEDLKRQGHTIIFLGTSSIQSKVVNANFQFEEFRYMPTFEVRTTKGFFGQFLKSLLNPQEKITRFRDFVVHIRFIEEKIEQINPDIIIIDEHLSHYFIYVEKFGKSWYSINTKLPSGKSPGIPPLNSSYLASQNFLSRMYCELIWIKHLLLKRLPRYLTSFAFLGSSNESFELRFIKKTKSKIGFTDKTSMYDYDNAFTIPCINLISQKFNYSWRQPAASDINLHYWNNNDEQLSPLLSNIINNNNLKKPIVYCGLGTMSSRSADQYIIFLKSLIRAWQIDANYILIISTGNAQISSALSHKEKDIYIFDHVSQAALLPQCHLMITHGGLNSIKEGIQAETPLLGIINPLHHHTDTLGNIARITHHGIGLSCNITDKAIVISQRIRILLEQEKFKNQIKFLKTEIERSEKVVFITDRYKVEVT